MKRFLVLVLMPFVLFGCGYAPHTQGSGIGVSTLYIEPLENLTAEPFLDSMVTDSLRERFARDHRLALVNNPKDAEAVLSGNVSQYHRSAVSYDRADDIQQYRSFMKITASLRRVADGKILWKNDVSWTEESMNNSDRSVQRDNENVAIQTIVDRLSEQLYFRMQDDF